MNIKKDYSRVEKKNLFYCKVNDVKNEVVDMLYILFAYHGADLEWLLHFLLRPATTEIKAELAEIYINNDKITLQPSLVLDDNPEEHAVEISREELIRMAYEWRALVLKNTSPIYIFYKDKKCGVADVLPEGVE